MLHETVIEVARHDKETHTYYVVSGWYQNIRNSPDVTMHVGWRKFRAQTEFVPLAKSIEIMEAYAHDHSLAFSELSSLFLGEHMKPGNYAARRLAEKCRW